MISNFSLRQYELRQVLRVLSQLPGNAPGNTPKVKYKDNDQLRITNGELR